MQLGNANALGTGSATVNAGTLDLNGYNLAVSGFGGAGGTVLSNSSGVTSTLTVSNTAGARTYSGALANGFGTLALTTTGAGQLTLAGVNTYTGATNIMGGTLGRWRQAARSAAPLSPSLQALCSMFQP